MLCATSRCPHKDHVSSGFSVSMRNPWETDGAGWLTSPYDVPSWGSQAHSLTSHPFTSHRPQDHCGLFWTIIQKQLTAEILNSSSSPTAQPSLKQLCPPLPQAKKPLPGHPGLMTTVNPHSHVPPRMPPYD